VTLLDMEQSMRRGGLVPERKSFRCLSASDTGNGPVVYATASGGYCENIEGIDFDDVTRRLYSDLPKTVKSADALYANGGDAYLIEFKTGDAPADDMYRKFYDSSLTLAKAGVFTLDQCRERVVGILVRTDVSRKWRHYDLGRSTRSSDAPRYEYVVPADLPLMTPSEDFRILSGYVLKKIYVMDSADFDAFGRNEGWR